ncbi:MAG: UDP-N-acetylmuramate dehydrogenase [Clostridia bacterium]|nr:UDP-N-acetylmuramate dehydrogenase [Clostridia bacterium]
MSRQKLSLNKLKKLNHHGEVLQSVEFSEFCTFKCGGKLKVLLKINTLENFIKIMYYLEEIGEKFFVLGAGSNVLCSDGGYDGVVIKLEGDFVRSRQLSETEIECGAGVKLSQLFAIAKSLGLSGLECGAGIPATIGGATFMNAGAYGFEMSQIIKYVVAYVDGRITYFDNSDCQFDYRHSVFQENNGVILRVGFAFQKRNIEDIDFDFKETMKKRLESQPLDYPNAGSIFKRIDGIVVSKVLDNCGVKGLTLGSAKVSDKHANFIINTGNAESQDIYELIEIIKYRVKKQTGIELQTEIKLLGEFDEVTW